MTKNLKSDLSDRQRLVGQLSGRYGALALARAAGEAAAAERRGDREKMTLWQSVVVELRQEIAGVSAT